LGRKNNEYPNDFFAWETHGFRRKVLCQDKSFPRKVRNQSRNRKIAKKRVAAWFAMRNFDKSAILGIF